MPNKPFAPACEKNKDVILDVLRRELRDCRRVLEIGSGTGQHAVYFARNLPHLVWCPSDLGVQHAGILAWIADAKLANIEAPIELNVDAPEWPVTGIDAVFSANTLHILSWESITRLFEGVGRVLSPGGRVAIYGPFNYGGAYTSESNAAFDRALRTRDPLSGIRHFEEVDALAAAEGLILHHDHAMPSNNRLLVWRRPESAAAP